MSMNTNIKSKVGCNQQVYLAWQQAIQENTSRQHKLVGQYNVMLRDRKDQERKGATRLPKWFSGEASNSMLLHPVPRSMYIAPRGM